MIVLAAHGVNGSANCQEFDNIFALSCQVPKKMSCKIPWSRAWDDFKGNIEWCIISLHIFGKEVIS